MALLILNCGHCEQSLAEHSFPDPNRTIHIPYREHECEDETGRIPAGTIQVNIASTDENFEWTITIFPKEIPE
jgi:hypothetical protein